eukprot:275063-Pelagomonas_calceolata.AAC.1
MSYSHMGALPLQASCTVTSSLQMSCSHMGAAQSWATLVLGGPSALSPLHRVRAQQPTHTPWQHLILYDGFITALCAWSPPAPGAQPAAYTHTVATPSSLHAHRGDMLTRAQQPISTPRQLLLVSRTSVFGFATALCACFPLRQECTQQPTRTS